MPRAVRCGAAIGGGSDGRRLTAERGQGLAEYIIIVVIVAVAVILGIRYFGGSIFNNFESAKTEINKAGSADEPTSAEGAGGGASGSGGTGGGGPDSAGRAAGDRAEPSGKAAPPTNGAAERANNELSGSGGGGSSLDDKVSRLRQGVGDPSAGSDPVALTVPWQTLLLIGGVAVAVSLLILFRARSKMTKKKGPKKKRRLFSLFGKLSGKAARTDEKGQAIAEFTLVAITFLFVLLGVVQLAMVLNAYTMVRYAAYNAARAAIVHGGNRDKMLEAARLSLVATFPRHGRADHVVGFMENYLGAVATDDNPILTTYLQPITKVELQTARAMAGGSTVTFDDPVAADDGVITVKVTHLYELVIPLVNRMLFWVYTRNKFGPGYQGESVDFVAKETDRLRRNGAFRDIEYRIPLVGFYTMRLQSDLEVN